jgi:hypothetical protein
LRKRESVQVELVLEEESEKEGRREFGCCGRDNREELFLMKEEEEVVESERMVRREVANRDMEVGDEF